MQWFNSVVVQFPWLLPLLLSVGLWLGLQPRKLTTEQIVKKYAAKKQARINRDDEREKQFKARVEARKTKTAIERTEASDRIERRLSAYLFFDVNQTSRLVDGVQAKFPDKTREWCAEKALSDLERDRQTR